MEPLSPDARPASPIDGRFHLQEEAGRGGMGVVWKAWDQGRQTWVAVKVLHVMRATVAARFDREIRLLEGVGHPYVVRYHDQGVLPDGRRYLVMEWVAGETLAQRLQRGSLSLDDAIELGRKLASALGAAHQRGIVHRDFKPSNVLLVGGDLQQPRLLDFGIARDVESQTHLTASEAILGTPGYVAPEQARSSRLADPRADIYALGVTLYECLTGCLPFSGATPIERLMAPLQSPPTPLRNLRPDASPYLEQIFDRMLARDPSLRPENGDTAERWLAAASTSLHGSTPIETMDSLPPLTPVGQTPSGPSDALGPATGPFPPGHTAMDMVDSLDIVPTRRTPPKAQRRPWAWVALAATMLVVGLGGGYWLSRSDGSSARDTTDERTSDDRSPPDDEEDRKKTRRAKVPPREKTKRPRREEPHAFLPKSSVCPGEHCELIPRRMWDGASVEEAFAYIEKRRKKLYPDAKFQMLVAPAVRKGRVEPRSQTSGTLMVSYLDGASKLQATFMLAHLSFMEEVEGGALASGHPAPVFSSCPLEKAYRVATGRLDKRWQKGELSVQAMWMPLSGTTPVWFIDQHLVDVNTCRLLKTP